jgi:hypothetical protein
MDKEYNRIYIEERPKSRLERKIYLLRLFPILGFFPIVRSRSSTWAARPVLDVKQDLIIIYI